MPLKAGGPWLSAVARVLKDRLEPNAYPLRFSIARVNGEQAELEVTALEYDPDDARASALSEIEVFRPRRKAFQVDPFCAVQIVPTGIRCEFGGFAGDACPVTNLLASAVDFLITHPNAVNASELNEMAANTLYVEGKALDDFLLGHLGLVPSRANIIGTVVDATGREYFDHVVNVLNAARSAAGIDCGLYNILEEELGAQIAWSSSGCAVGTVARIDTLMGGVEKLLEAGANAIGAVSVIHGATREMFLQHLEGVIPNPSGGVEAILSHLVSKLFRVPTAHAPLPYYSDLKGHHTSNPCASAEFISIPHYFSVLKGLHRAPRLMSLEPAGERPQNMLTIDNVGAIIAPSTALGGIPALAAEYSSITLIAVRENRTILNVSNETLRMSNVIEVNSYIEAAGVLLAMRQGISIESLRRPLPQQEPLP